MSRWSMLALLPLAVGCRDPHAGWVDRPGAFNEALTKVKIGTIPVGGAIDKDAVYAESYTSNGSVSSAASFEKYDPSTRRVCFIRTNPIELGDEGDLKKYIAREQRPDTYEIDVWDTLDGLAPLPIPPRGFNATPVEVTVEQSNGLYNYTVSQGGVDVGKVGGPSAYMRVCGVAIAALAPGKLVTLVRKSMPNPGYDNGDYEAEVFVWKVGDAPKPDDETPAVEPEATPEESSR